MGAADFYRDGDYNAICDSCGYKYKFSSLKKRWDNIYCCYKCFEIRHPQDYLKGIRDNMSVPIARPESPNNYIAPIGIASVSISSINYILNLTKYIIIGVSSIVSIITTYYPFTPASKVVDGAALNSTTLG